MFSLKSSLPFPTLLYPSLPFPCHLQYGHETRVVLGQGKNHPGLGLRTEAQSTGASFTPGAD